MFKQHRSPSEDQVPSYEESIQGTPSSYNTEKITSGKSNLRQRLAQQRAQRIQNLITIYIEPQIAYIDIDSVSDRTLILFPSDCLPSTSAPQVLTRSNIVTPSTPPGEVEIVQLEGEENKSSFWSQASVIQELSTALNQLLDSISDHPEILLEPQPPIPPRLNPEERPTLPARPSKASWMARKLGLMDPGPDYDPTGSTGKWNLGWRNEADDEVRSPTRAGGLATLAPGQIGLHAQTRLRDVSFRTENEMGLIETRTVKCIWIGITVNLDSSGT